MKDKEDAKGQAGETCRVIPPELFAEIGHRKNSEYGERDDLLNCLQLSRVELIGADAICGNLKTIFEKRDAPAGEDHFPERFAAVLEVAVPCEGHENVGNGQQNNGAHEAHRGSGINQNNARG